MSDELEILNQFDDGYSPTNLDGPKLEELPDGQYTFAYVSARFKVSEKQRKPLVEFMLRDTATGKDYGHVQMLSVQKNADILGADLCKLGFAAEMGHGKKFSEGLMAVLPRLPGVTFAAEKVTKDGYPNLYIKSKLASVGAVPAAAPTDDNSIPF